MTISAGSDILASDFISTSAGAADSGKAAKLNSDGKFDSSFINHGFGGTGADGALSITSGTTNIDCAGARVVVKNYTSISITGTGNLTFSNPHANGTVVILKSQGGVTLTSSAAPMISVSAMGAIGGTAVTTTGSGGPTAGNNGTDGLTNQQKSSLGGGAATGSGGGGGAASGYYFDTTLNATLLKHPEAFVGAGGGSGLSNNSASGSGTSVSGRGGRGGGCLIIECAGAWNFTTTGGISVAGENGQNATTTSAVAGGGGGGSGGYLKVLYGSLTANSGTVNVAGGTGGNNDNNTGSVSWGGGGGGSPLGAGSNGTNSASDGAKTGGDGATGLSFIGANVDFA